MPYGIPVLLHCKCTVVVLIFEAHNMFFKFTPFVTSQRLKSASAELSNSAAYSCLLVLKPFDDVPERRSSDIH